MRKLRQLRNYGYVICMISIDIIDRFL